MMRRGNPHGQAIVDALRIYGGPRVDDDAGSEPASASSSASPASLEGHAPATSATSANPAPSSSSSSSTAAAATQYAVTVAPPAPTKTQQASLPAVDAVDFTSLPAAQVTAAQINADEPEIPQSAKSDVSSPSPTTTSFKDVDFPSPKQTIIPKTFLSSGIPPHNVTMVPLAISVVTSASTATISATASATTALVQAENTASATSSADTDNELGDTRKGDNDTKANHKRVSGTGIALGTVAGVALLVSIGFLLWKWRRRRNHANVENGARLPSRDSNWPHPDDYPRVRQPGGSTKSISIIIDELIDGVYATEEMGGNNYQSQSQQSGAAIRNAYTNEKKRSLDPDRGFDYENNPMVEQQPVPQQPNVDNSVSRWLIRQRNEQMQDPWQARTSFVSSAAGLVTTLPPGSPGSYPGAYQPSRESEIGRAAVPPPLDPKLFSRETLVQPQAKGPQLKKQQASFYYDNISPIAVEPTELRVTPSRVPSMAPTETTDHTESTWNTWGVQQHHEQPKAGFKSKLRL